MAILKHISIIDHVGAKAGMDYYSSSLANGLIQQQCNCTVYSNFTGKNSDKINYKPYFEGHSKNNSLTKLFRLIVATLKSSIDAKKHRTDLIILHLFSANLVTLLLTTIPKVFGLKVAVIAHDISSFIGNDSSFMQNIIYNTCSDHIIVHNNFSYKELLKHVAIKKSEKIVVIKHGGYIEHIKESLTKNIARKALGLDVNGNYMLFFGQIKEVKGLDILLEAMTKTPENIKLIIAGKPWKSDFSKYDLLIKNYRLENRIIKKIRFIEDDEREKLFFAADVNILPYRTIYQSGVLLMAMSHSLPVIASDLPANKEIIEDKENGMLFESEKSSSLTDKINAFFKQNNSMLATKAFQTIKNEYNWNEISKAYLHILKK